MNPLTVCDRIVKQYNWEHFWPTDSELIATVPGQWTNYNFHFIWQENINVLYLVCCSDIVFQEPYSIELLSFLATVNQRLWIGHFDLVEDGELAYRHALHIMGEDETELQEVIQSCMGVIIGENELFYPGFSKVHSKEDLSTQEMDLLSMQVGGQA